MIVTNDPTMTKLHKLRQRIPAVRNCYHILQCLGVPTVALAQRWLELLGATSDLVCRYNSWIPVWKLLEDLPPDRPAFYVTMHFIGGPPKGLGCIRTYRGSLYTFLVDRILYYVEKVGLEVTESVLDIPLVE